MRKLIFVICMLCFFSSLTLANSGYFEPCGKHPFSFFYFHETNKLYSGCLTYEGSRKLIVSDPLTLNTNKEYTVNSFVECVEPVNNGYSLLILLSDVDCNGGTEDGVLRQIAYSDGHTEHEYSFSTIPLGLVVDSQENYAYVSSGLAHTEVDPIITKINLSTWQRVGEDVKYGRFSNYLALTHDDSKLYVKTCDVVRHDHVTNIMYFGIGVFDTSDMSKINEIEINVMPSVIKMGYDNRLYVGGEPLTPEEPSLFVINTTNDTVTPLIYANAGFIDIALDNINHKLYASTTILQWDSEYKIHIPEPSNMVYQIDLENQYSYQVFTPAEENIVLIEAVPIDDPNYSCRLFATASEGKKVYYMDIP